MTFQKITEDKSMDVKNWKKGIELHIPILNAFVKKVILKQTKCDVTFEKSCDAEEVLTFFDDIELCVKAEEENFDTEVLLGFKKDWFPLLNSAMLGIEDDAGVEITQDVLTEFSSKLFQLIQNKLSEAKVITEIQPFENVKKARLKKSLTYDRYFVCKILVSPTFNVEKEKAKNLELLIVIAEPNQEKIQQVLENWGDINPLFNEDYIVDSTLEQEIPEMHKSTKEQKKVNVKGEYVEFESFDKARAVKNDIEVRNMDILRDVEVDVSVELGKKHLPLGKVLKLVKGSVIELEKMAGEPVDILVNGRPIAIGDVVVIDEFFGVRITKLLESEERIRSLA